MPTRPWPAAEQSLTVQECPQPPPGPTSHAGRARTGSAAHRWPAARDTSWLTLITSSGRHTMRRSVRQAPSAASTRPPRRTAASCVFSLPSALTQSDVLSPCTPTQPWTNRRSGQLAASNRHAYRSCSTAAGHHVTTVPMHHMRQMRMCLLGGTGWFEHRFRSFIWVAPPSTSAPNSADGSMGWPCRSGGRGFDRLRRAVP
jgi:hypothetical protein